MSDIEENTLANAAAAMLLDALSGNVAGALVRGVATVVITCHPDAVSHALYHFGDHEVGVEGADPVPEMLATYAAAPLHSKLRDKMEDRWPDLFIPFEILEDGNAEARAILVDYVRDRSLPAGTFPEFSAWEAGATAPRPEFGFAEDKAFQGYKAVKIGDTVRITSNPAPWIFENVVSHPGMPEALVDKVREFQDSGNVVGAEFVVTDVFHETMKGRVSNFVTGDPGGRGVWTCHLEVVARA